MLRSLVVAFAVSLAGTAFADDKPLVRGAPFTLKAETPLKDIVAKPDRFVAKVVKVRGTVEKCCENKGCWMEVRAPGVETGVRVRFKDYAFFVPVDSKGKEVTLEGQVQIETLNADMVKHLEGEGAKLVKNAKGESVTLTLVATSVELRSK